MAAKDDKLILDKRLEEQRAAVANTMSESEYFEVFTAEQILKDFDLSYEEIQSGIVDGSRDGGIDSAYVFVNGDLVQEDSDHSTVLKDVVIDLVIIQSKSAEGFEETAIQKITSATTDLFDTSHTLSSYKGTYNEGLLRIAQLFQATYQNLAGRLPRLRVTYHYATKGDSVHPNVSDKAKVLEQTIKDLFSSVEVSVNFHTARALIDLARRTPKSTRQIVVTESISAAKGTAFIALAKLKDFYTFILDDGGKLASHIFEANVRDYLGDAAVNEGIRQTLSAPQTEDFWWLNNGVTILSSQVTLSGKTLTIENPEIVNGLQTSREIFDFFNSGGGPADERDVLIRVVVPTAAESRYNIIRATNSQTAISPASLRATDPIQRDIDEYLRAFNIFYDRRKNYYKNQGKPIKSIVGIPQLAQAVEAIVLQQPNTARARPSSLIKQQEDYEKLFTSNYPIEVYRACVDIIKATEAFLANHPDEMDSVEKNDLKYYVAMITTTILLKTVNPTPVQVATLAGTSISEIALEQAYKTAKEKYKNLGGDDTVAKGPQMLAEVVSVLTQGSLF